MDQGEPALVLVCQGCPHAWEPGTAERAEFDSRMREGCPECGDWLWVGEVAGVEVAG